MKRFSVDLLIVLVVCLVTILAFPLPEVDAFGGESNWPQWRGPESQGISSEKNLPVEWSATKNIKWKTPIAGRGHSSPIVWGKKIFLTTSVEGPVIPGAKPPKHIIGNEEFVHPDWAGSDRSYTFKVICLDSDTGKTLWDKTAYEGRVYDHRHRKNTYASPTPATDGRFVYSFFGSEDCTATTLAAS